MKEVTYTLIAGLIFAGSLFSNMAFADCGDDDMEELAAYYPSLA